MALTLLLPLGTYNAGGRQLTTLAAHLMACCSWARSFAYRCGILPRILPLPLPEGDAAACCIAHCSPSHHTVLPWRALAHLPQLRHCHLIPACANVALSCLSTAWHIIVLFLHLLRLPPFSPTRENGARAGTLRFPLINAISDLRTLLSLSRYPPGDTNNVFSSAFATTLVTPDRLCGMAAPLPPAYTRYAPERALKRTLNIYLPAL